MTELVSNFKLLSINANGLGDARNRRLVFNSLNSRKLKNSIFLLRETHCRLGNESLWRSQWGGQLFVSETSGNAGGGGGVAILFSRDLEPNNLNVTFSRQNRFLIAHFSIFGENYRVVSVYMPTSDREKIQIEVLEELKSALDNEDDDLTFVGGDFNVLRPLRLFLSCYTQQKF